MDEKTVIGVYCIANTVGIEFSIAENSDLYARFVVGDTIHALELVEIDYVENVYRLGKMEIPMDMVMRV